MAFFLYAGKRLHTFCTPFAHLLESGAFLRKVCTACFPLQKNGTCRGEAPPSAIAERSVTQTPPLGCLLFRKRKGVRRTRLSSTLCVRLHPLAGWLQGSLCRRFLLPPAFRFAGVGVLPGSGLGNRGFVIYRMRLDFLVLRGRCRVSHADGHAVVKVRC